MGFATMGFATTGFAPTKGHSNPRRDATYPDAIESDNVVTLVDLPSETRAAPPAR
jgi:hypothetical protein